MDKKHEKIMADLQRLLSTQDFKSEKDLSDFMNQISGSPIPSFPKEALSFEEQAQDLVFEAYELPPVKAKVNIKKALELNPDCIEAYEYLGSRTTNLKSAMSNFEKGIAIGRKIFGGKYLKEHKGYFWGLHETRPFMRCLMNYSDCLIATGKMIESIDILEEMIELNPNDNQGVRDQLMLYLILLDNDEKFRKYAKIYEDNGMTFHLFNLALFAFKTEGESDNANQKLKEAIKQNKNVTPKILSKKMIEDLPQMYGIGDENEANYYVSFALPIWNLIPGSFEWLEKHTGKKTATKKK